jgi:hypothetical protein
MKASLHCEILRQMTCAFQRPHGKVQAPRTYARRAYGRTAHKDSNSTIDGFLRLLKNLLRLAICIIYKEKKEEAGNNELGSGKRWCRSYLLSR